MLPVFIPCRPLFAALLLALTLAGRPAAQAHGALDEKIANLRAAVLREPGAAQWRFDLAVAHYEHGDWELALAHLDRVDEMAPGQFVTDLLRGQAWLAGGQPGAAKKALDQFLAAQPTHVRGLTLRGRVSAALGEATASIAHFRAALKNAPTTEPELIQETADALAANGQGEEAVEVLTAGIVKIGPAPSLVLRAMELEIQTGHFEAALARVDAMQKAAPRPEPWMAKRAVVLAQAGRVADARAAWTALLTHLAALPEPERRSHAMSMIAEQARKALTSLHSLSSNTAQPASP